MKTSMSGVLVFLFFLAGIPGIDAGSGGAAEPAALNPGEVVELSGDIKIVGHEPFVQTVLETPSGRPYALTGQKVKELHRRIRITPVKIRARVLREGDGPLILPELELLSFTPVSRGAAE